VRVVELHAKDAGEMRTIEVPLFMPRTVKSRAWLLEVPLALTMVLRVSVEVRSKV